jgi:uncharacterized protein YkwD
VRLQVEELESRLTPSGLQPSALEQEFLERLNDARANPPAYGASIGLNLAGVAPSQPLAFNTRLIAAARGHAGDMATRGYFAHFTPEGVSPGKRMRQAGFPANSWAESIDLEEVPTLVFNPDQNAPPVRQPPSPEQALADLIIDAGVPDLGHRKHLLAIDPVARKHAQVGVGFASHDLTGPDGFGFTANFWTVDTAAPGPHQQFLTGSVFHDANHNGLYDAGEGISGVTIRVSGVGAVRDFDSGGYTVQLPHGGNYRVTASGGGLPAPITRTVHAGGKNVRLNFIVP